MRPFEVLEAVRHGHTTMDKVNDEQNVVDKYTYVSVHGQRFLKDTGVSLSMKGCPLLSLS